jgi:hypothetical protein
MAKRIWTKRTNDGVEYMELHNNGVVFWGYDDPDSGGLFFVDADFISEKFTETGRLFDVSKMPENFVSYPQNGMVQ